MVMGDENDFGQDFRFRVRLLIRHYSLPAKAITDVLGAETGGHYSIGEPIVLPYGQKLDRLARFTSWSVSKDFEGEREFFPPGMAFLNGIVGANDAFVRGLTETGGEVTLIFDLPGDVNVGANLEAAGVARLAELKMALGVEVFPHFPPGARGRARAASRG